MAFALESETPPGFVYAPDFVTPAEEAALVREASALPFREVRMHGVVARRTVLHFGWDYDYAGWTLERAEPIPAWLLPLRDRAAALASLPPASLVQVLVARYPPGATIGWHRDAPMFGPVVVGVSLAGACTMRFRPSRLGGRATYQQVLAARSAYVIGGPARSAWQHSIPPVKSLRYSISFRTVPRPPT